MVGLVVATHGQLGCELIATAEQIVGKVSAVTAVSIQPGASPADIHDQMEKAVSSVDSGDGVIILADLFGGTPCNQSLMLLRDHDLEVVTGVNLPMLLKANSLRGETQPLTDLAISLAQYGQKNITCASSMLRRSDAPLRRN